MFKSCGELATIVETKAINIADLNWKTYEMRSTSKILSSLLSELADVNESATGMSRHTLSKILLAGMLAKLEAKQTNNMKHSRTTYKTLLGSLSKSVIVRNCIKAAINTTK